MGDAYEGPAAGIAGTPVGKNSGRRSSVSRLNRTWNHGESQNIKTVEQFYRRDPHLDHFFRVVFVVQTIAQHITERPQRSFRTICDSFFLGLQTC